MQALPLHPRHPVQLHIIAPAEALGEGVVLDLQLGDLGGGGGGGERDTVSRHIT